MLLVEFDEELWNATIKTVVVHSEDSIIFKFKNGMELEWNIVSI
ncbi:hypothetical protein [Clostridium sp.]